MQEESKIEILEKSLARVIERLNLLEFKHEQLKFKYDKGEGNKIDNLFKQ